jgi:hypothetical protein
MKDNKVFQDGEPASAVQSQASLRHRILMVTHSDAPNLSGVELLKRLRDDRKNSEVGHIAKAALSNLFLLGCLLGLFVLYCCSCVIHVLTFPTRRKSS